MRLNNYNATPSRYYPFIDGLRALAVISVIIYHLHASWLPGGFVGVDVFFVISGFVVSASITHFRGSGFWHFLAFFYARRIRRIFPALIVCLLVTAVVSALFIPDSWLSDVNQQTGLFAFFGLSNFILAANGRDYFAPTTEFNPFTHTWSLGVEEQFYLIFPALFFAWLCGQRGRGISVALFAIGLLTSAVFSAWQSQVQPTNAYFLSPGRFWELASGVLLYQIITWSRPQGEGGGSGFANTIGVAAFIGLLISFVVSTPHQFPMPGALLAAVSTLGIIYSLYRQPGLPWLHALLGNRYILFFGKTSYSLYLWHWPTFVLFRWTCGLESPLTMLCALAVTLVLATLSYYLIETPMRQSGLVKKAANALVISAGLCVIAIACWGASVLNAHSNRLSLSQVSADADLWYPDRGPATPDFPGCRADPQTLDVEGTSVMVIKPEGCLQESASRYNVLHVIGDSHTLAYMTLYKQLAIRNNLQVDVYRNGGCPFVSFQTERDLDDAHCRQNIASSLRALRQRIRPGDVLLLASLRLPRFGDQWVYFGAAAHQQSFFSDRAQANRQRSVEWAIDVLREFSAKGAQVVFEAPKPIFQVPPYRCADWFNRDNPICAPGMTMDRALLQKYRAPVLDSYAQVVQAVPSVSVWDPFPVLCPGEVCSVWKDGHALFFDGDHLSAWGSMTLLADFSARVLPRLRKPAREGSMHIPEQGYAFNQQGVPDFLDSLSGLSHVESWGRWSDGRLAPVVRLAFHQPLPQDFTLEVTAQGYGPNINQPVSVVVGNERHQMRVAGQPTTTKLYFANPGGARVIEITPPYPQSPQASGESGDGRLLGIGLVAIKITAAASH
ncbi:acyltransferase family protein [Entomohabitans teleogrylli]|uniref:acyltransferase family protein n=1 Tax=Entomohabitans teleogrylli TaxID=1384589 RepID=UPI00073D5B42|nr:acyltransferase family protein [Entomohabitans teleogrylli]